MQREALAGYAARHFRWQVDERVATITLDRPEKKNPLTFDSYAELRDLFRALATAEDVRAVVVTGAGGNFCSGGDVHEIIGPLVAMQMPELLAFTRMTGDLVKAMRACPQPVIAAIDGVCAGAGAMIACAADLRYATPTREDRVPVRARRARGRRHGRLHAAAAPHRPGPRRRPPVQRPLDERRGRAGLGLLQPRRHRRRTARRSQTSRRALLAAGPTFAHGMTKTMLNQEWSMTLEQAIEAEAQAQAICMQTQDFRRAYEAFAARRTPRFEGD